MNLTSLITEIETLKIPDIPPTQDGTVQGVSHDTRTIEPGEVFVALVGDSFNGHEYIQDAINKGAIAVVGVEERKIKTVPYIQVANSRLALAQLAAAFHGFPGKKLNVIGVTGTDGKTTTVSLIHHILTNAGFKAGMISTINARIGEEEISTGFHVTTPEAQKIQSLLNKMVEAGMTHVVLEATSHGLEQFRAAECYFDVGAVTNITHEHLDYHGDYDNYLKAKSRLFTWLGHGVKKPDIVKPIAVLNRDDISYQPLTRIINDELQDSIHLITYGASQDCDIAAKNIKSSDGGLSFDVIENGKVYPFTTTMIGVYNVFNILAAIGVATQACGINIPDTNEAVASFPGVPGRMEEIDLGQNFSAIVDFAHTPNALEVALRSSQLRTKNRVIAVFGSAGLRDREKRRMMASTSIRTADITIITAEDPRTERLEDILAEMEDEALKEGGKIGEDLFIVPDRGRAIEHAVGMAEQDDLVIICGKGHEQSMCFESIEYPWDDRTALRSALASHLEIDGPDMPFLPTREI